ncbi:uncharacterized protein LOC134612676 [Pelobates fuscus]|uniref:uncharacterized protein LOC134612676 n=1 Tax=Pelobates fuscus TaxID=191477 RepID=UPI002FE450E7
MKLLAGIVQLLFLQNWSLMMGRAMPVSSTSCAHSNNCSDIDTIVVQIQNKIRQMNAIAQNLTDQYIQRNGITNLSQCNPESGKGILKTKNTSIEQTMNELYNISVNIRDALHNVTEFQKTLTSRQPWFDQLDNTVTGIEVIILNLRCYLCKANIWNQETVRRHHTYFSQNNSTYAKKISGCKVIMKYRNIISQAAEIDFVALRNSGRK